MGHLGQGVEITTVSTQKVVLTDSKGQNFTIEPSILAVLFSNMNNGMSERALEIGQDLNLITKSGVYYSAITQVVTTIENKPSTGAKGEISLLVIGCDDRYTTQLYFNITSMLLFIRFQKVEVWSVWKQISFT